MLDRETLDKIYLSACEDQDFEKAGLVTKVRQLQLNIGRLHAIMAKDYDIVIVEVAKQVADIFEVPERQRHWSLLDYREVVRQELWDMISAVLEDQCLTVSRNLHAQCLIAAASLELRDDLMALWSRTEEDDEA